jgi:hypothetical protein
MQLVIVRYIHEKKEEQNLPPTGTKKYNIKKHVYMLSLVFLDAGHSINLWMVTECINMEHDMVDLLPFKYVNNEEYLLE